MKSISVSKFKATCLHLLERVSKTGRPLLITKNGSPLAQVVPAPAPQDKEHWIGMAKGELEIVGDIVSPVSGPEDWDALKK